ncbi:MAG: hypothetical protein ACYCTV_11055 [Leptospirales bacterium]
MNRTSSFRIEVLQESFVGFDKVDRSFPLDPGFDKIVAFLIQRPQATFLETKEPIAGIKDPDRIPVVSVKDGNRFSGDPFRMVEKDGLDP